MNTAIRFFLRLLVIENPRKLLGVELVRIMGNMMLWMFVVMHVLYVDWNKKVFLPIDLRISVEKRNTK